MSAFEIGCAVLSSATYIEGRQTQNRTPLPSGATKVAITGLTPDGHYVDPAGSGFEASLYVYQGKYVIAFSGTDPSDVNDLSADAMLGFGVMEEQLKQAAEFYKKVKAQVGVDITFTGHSLGGGLAALMGVFFNKPAVTFDPAPFRVAATLSNAQALQSYLTKPTANRPAYAIDADLASYTTTEQSIYTAQTSLALTLSAIAAAAGVTPTPVLPLLSTFVASSFARFLLTCQYPTTIRGEANIKAIAVSGEFLTNGYKGFGSDWENALRIKSTAQPELIDINPVGVKLGAFDLHSMQLLVIAATDPRFETLIKKIPILAEYFFDKSLYAESAKSTTTDFLNKLVREEYSGSVPTGYIKKFADDLTKLVGDTGIAQTQLQKELAIVAMEYYYFKDAASATSIFTVANGGLHFKYSDIGASTYKSLPRLEAAIEGLLSTAEKPLAGNLLKQNAWHIQQGVSALVWTATSGDMQNDAAIGGVGVDILDAGAGSDVLTGGTGSDMLMGGLGVDTYLYKAGDGSDTIIDSDGQVVVKIDNITLTGGKKAAPGYWVSDDKQYGFALVTNGTNDTASNDISWLVAA